MKSGYQGCFLFSRDMVAVKLCQRRK